jgi:hypothetical protein
LPGRSSTGRGHLRPPPGLRVGPAGGPVNVVRPIIPAVPTPPLLIMFGSEPRVRGSAINRL